VKRLGGQRDRLAALLVALLCIAATETRAQGRDRGGLLAGAGFGLGDSAPDLCNGCGTGLAVGGRLGTVLRSRLAVSAVFGSVSAAPNILSDVRGRHSGLLGVVRYWPGERLWLEGGLGVASVEREDPPRYDYSSTHLAGLVGGGFELNPRSRLVVDIGLFGLVSGDSAARFPGEAPHERSVRTLLLKLGATFYSR
jgi:hypothetical protein